MTANTTKTENSESPSPHLAILGETLRVCCVEMMADYGLEARASEGPAPSEAPVSVLVAGVDFRGRALRGTVAFWAAKEVILRTAQAAPGLEIDAADLPDWTCELANQLLGRVKNKLRAYDVSLSINVPRIIAGKEVTDLDDGLRYRFSCDFGTLSACLDVLTAPGFVLEKREQDESLAQEGDFTLF
jgi:hypothetical protein